MMHHLPAAPLANEAVGCNQEPGSDHFVADDQSGIAMLEDIRASVADIRSIAARQDRPPARHDGVTIGKRGPAGGNADNRRVLGPELFHRGRIAVGKGSIEGLVGKQDGVPIHRSTPWGLFALLRIDPAGLTKALPAAKLSNLSARS